MNSLLKKMGGFFVALILVLNLAACGGSTSTSDSTAVKESTAASTTVQEQKKEPVSLKFLYIWPENSELMQKTIDLFKEKNKDTVSDVVITTSTWDKVTAVLQTSIAANDQHDVAFMWPDSRMAELVKSGGVLDLTPYLDADKEWKDSFSDPANIFNLGTIDNKIYNIPFRGTAFFVAYNKTVFDKYGWSEPKTLEEFESLMDDMVKKGEVPFVANQSEGVLGYFKIQENILAGSYDDPNYKLGRKVGVIDPYTKAIQKSKDWMNKGYFGDKSYVLTREETQSLFYNGKGLMYFLNNNEIGAVKQGLGKNEMGLFAFPSPAKISDKVMFGGLDGFFASKNTKSPDAAVALLKHLTSKEVQQLWADEAASSMVVKGINYKEPLVQKASELLGYAGKYSLMPNYNQGDMETRNSQLFQEFILKGKLTAEDVAKQWDKNLQDALNAAGNK